MVLPSERAYEPECRELQKKRTYRAIAHLYSDISEVIRNSI